MRRRQQGQFETERAAQQDALRAEEARLKAEREKRIRDEDEARKLREHKRILADEAQRIADIKKRQLEERRRRIGVESAPNSDPGGKPISRDASALTEKVEQNVHIRHDGRENPRGHRPRK